MRMPQGVASLALGYVLHWAFSPPLLNPKLEASYHYNFNIIKQARFRNAPDNQPFPNTLTVPKTDIKRI